MSVMRTSSRYSPTPSPHHTAAILDADLMLVQYWPTVVDDGPTLNQQWANASCLHTTAGVTRDVTPNVVSLLAHRLRRRPNTKLALDERLVSTNVHPMTVHCWPTVSDIGPTLNQHWLNVSFLMGGKVICFQSISLQVDCAPCSHQVDGLLMNCF